MPSRDYASLLLNPLYAAMPEAARAAIEARGHIRRIAAGEQLFRKGEKGDGVYALLSGQVEYRTTSASGEESIVNIVETGKWLGDISTLDGAGRTMDCWALTNSVLMHLPTRDFLELVEAVPPFSRMLILLQGQRVREQLMWIEVLTKLGAEGRLAARLLVFSKARGEPVPDGIRIDAIISQEALAKFIGSTRQRINQILNQWQKEGLVRLEDRHIVLIDLDALKAYVDLA